MELSNSLNINIHSDVLNAYNSHIVNMRLNIYRMIIEAYTNKDLEKVFLLQKYYYLTFLCNTNLYYQSQGSMNLSSLSPYVNLSGVATECSTMPIVSETLLLAYPILSNMLAATNRTESQTNSLKNTDHQSQYDSDVVRVIESDELSDSSSSSTSPKETSSIAPSTTPTPSIDNSESEFDFVKLDYDRKATSLFHLTCHYGELVSTPKKEILFMSECSSCSDDKFCHFKTPHFHYLILYKTKRYDMFMACYRKLGPKRSNRLNKYSSDIIQYLIERFKMKRYSIDGIVINE
jgi:hypothetical protein